ncbi:hypothetical protein B0T13DRAFT_459418 [Neurospora crassa]|nr:hypothetical protein B0T13DRAFT_459418 [Neurospora crassa]
MFIAVPLQTCLVPIHWVDTVMAADDKTFDGYAFDRTFAQLEDVLPRGSGGMFSRSVAWGWWVSGNREVGETDNVELKKSSWEMMSLKSFM